MTDFDNVPAGGLLLLAGCVALYKVVKFVTDCLYVTMAVVFGYRRHGVLILDTGEIIVVFGEGGLRRWQRKPLSFTVWRRPRGG